MVNSHPLRLKIDARYPMWTVSIKTLDDAGLMLRQNCRSTAEVINAGTWGYAIIGGRKGTIVRYGCIDNDSHSWVATWNHATNSAGIVLPVRLLESEEPFSFVPSQEMPGVLLASPRIQKIYVNATKLGIVGILVGDTAQQMCSLVYPENGKLKIKDIETKAHSRNKHEVCAFGGATTKEVKQLLEDIEFIRCGRTDRPPFEAVKAKVLKRK